MSKPLRFVFLVKDLTIIDLDVYFSDWMDSWANDFNMAQNGFGLNFSHRESSRALLQCNLKFAPDFDIFKKNFDILRNVLLHICDLLEQYSATNYNVVPPHPWRVRARSSKVFLRCVVLAAQMSRPVPFLMVSRVILRSGERVALLESGWSRG